MSICYTVFRSSYSASALHGVDKPPLHFPANFRGFAPRCGRGHRRSDDGYRGWL